MRIPPDGSMAAGSEWILDNLLSSTLNWVRVKIVLVWEEQSITLPISGRRDTIGPIVFHLIWHYRNLVLGPSDPIWIRKRSEEHTSELQSRGHLVCRLL